jgi:hypothetical protein
MKRALPTWRRSPRRLDNLALVPASELASLEFWQQRARQLPPGNAIVVLSSDNLKLQNVGRQIQVTLERQACRTLVVPVPSSSPRQPCHPPSASP